MKNGKNLKTAAKAVVLLLSAALIFSAAGCTSRQKYNSFLNSLEIEIDGAPTAYVHYQKNLIINGKTLDFGEILKKSGIEGSVNEIYAISGETVWFGFSTYENELQIWHIASLDVGGQNVTDRFSGEFCSGDGADLFYHCNNTLGGFSDNGYYYGGKIVLTDRVKTVEYDIKTDKASEFSAIDYKNPSDVSIEIDDYTSVRFTKGNESKVLDAARAKETSKAFKKIYDEYAETKIWSKDSSMKYLFAAAQVADGEIYVVCEILNWDGESHAAVFKYDYAQNGVRYAFNCFMFDRVGTDLYVVPRI